MFLFTLKSIQKLVLLKSKDSLILVLTIIISGRSDRFRGAFLLLVIVDIPHLMKSTHSCRGQQSYITPCFKIEIVIIL